MCVIQVQKAHRIHSQRKSMRLKTMEENMFDCSLLCTRKKNPTDIRMEEREAIGKQHLCSCKDLMQDGSRVYIFASEELSSDTMRLVKI